MSNETLEVRIEIRVVDGGCQGQRWVGPRASPHPLKKLRLLPTSRLDLRGRKRPLSEPVEALVARRPGFVPPGFEEMFDERGQHDLGQYLYGQLFSSLAEQERLALEQAKEVCVTVVCQDVFLTSIPWVLLARDGYFLALDERVNWTIALAADRESLDRTVDFPSSPTMLIAVPNPCTAEYGETSAAEHVEELESALRLHHADLVRGKQLRVVDRWADLVDSLQTHPPDVLYYYGHGHGDRQVARLVFPHPEPGKGVQEIPVADLALRLQRLVRKPYIVYLNCCHGDAGAGLGAGRQLADTVPAVISNRSLAFVPQARAQAIRFFQQTLVQGERPHTAMRQLYQPQLAQDSVSNPRWMTPVFYRSYGPWLARPVIQSGWLPDTDWSARLDRDVQWAIVFEKTCDMLYGGARRGLAFLWYGEEGQGLDLFHQRLRTQFRKRLPQVCLLEYRPHWPDVLGAKDLSHEDVYGTLGELYQKTFGVQTLSDVQRAILRAADPQCPKTLVYIRHAVLTPRQVLNLRFLEDYVCWWDQMLPRMLGPGQFALLGISYQAAPGEDPETFQHLVAEQMQLEDLRYTHIHCHVLSRLGHVDRRHLRRFIDEIGFPLPANRREQIVEDIWERSEHGMYEKVIVALQALLRTLHGGQSPG
ncbi:MAG: hypothetical protein KJ000_33475 [Pirellulaceae bacterium]|nr:hypothetical protein [Pirellulaceae bacterium]